MIYKIYASDTNFKAIEFQIGLNVILADKQSESGGKDSRNGLGKTTLLSIIDFCLGSKLNQKAFPIEKIKEWTFFVELDICGEKITAARSIRDASIIKIQGNTSTLPVKAERSQNGHFDFYKLSEWQKLLGISFFNLKDITRSKYIPTFRMLIPYFLRRGTYAYNDPFSCFKNQPLWNTQVCNAYLLGLNWEQAAIAQEIKDKSKALQSFDKAVKTGIVASKGELEAERIRLQIEFNRDKTILSEFKVHPLYQEIQEQANSISQEIHDLSNQSLILRRKLDRYEESIDAEQTPDISAVEALYEEAGLYFGDVVKKTLADARIFHTQIVQNRKHFLKAEIEEMKNQLLAISKKIEEGTNKRTELMLVLQTHGALEEFTIFQERLIEKKERLEKIKSQIIDIEEMSVQKKEIKVKKIELETKIQRDYEQARPEWEKAVAEFNENTQALYPEAGNLVINCSENGYSFNVEIPRSNSEGIGKMKIFCYDLMLVNLFAKQKHVNFLFHDSTIFDGVDSRQTAHALEHAHRKAIESGFQYICSFNSDMIPKNDFSKDFDIQSFVRLTLTDKDPKDCLMGFRFNE